MEFEKFNAGSGAGEMTKDLWTAVILAGGLGSRLNPLTARVPKPLVTVAGQPMIDYAIDSIVHAGIKKIIILVKHLGDKIRSYVQNKWTPEICEGKGIIIEIPDRSANGTASAVAVVSDMIHTPHFLVSMADIVTNIDLKKFMEFHINKNAFASVSMKSVESMATQYGNTLLNEEGRILRFLEKPRPEEIYLSAITSPGAGMLPIINTGLYCFKSQILDMLISQELSDFGHEVFPYLLEHHYDLFGYVARYYWMDVGNPTTYLWACWDMLRLYGYPLQPVGLRIDSRHLWLPAGSEYGSQRFKEQYVAIGKGVKIQDSTQILQLTVLEDNVEVGENTQIVRSVVWSEVKIGKNCFLENAIICNDVEIADGCRITGYCIVGPGTKIKASGSSYNNRIFPANTIIE